jgi:hypothetical protein
MIGMSAVQGRARRSREALPTVSLQARVSPDVRAEIEAAAAASGVSLAYYLDAFFKSQVDTFGSLPLVPSPRPQLEELPIADVA